MANDTRDSKRGEILSFSQASARRLSRPGRALTRADFADAPLLDLLFDDLGRSWPVGSKELARALGYQRADFDIADFAIRKMGWVGVRFGLREITVRIASTGGLSAAVAGAIEALADMRSVPVRLAFADAGRWRPELFDSAAAAIARLERLTASPAMPTTRFVGVRQPLEVIFRDKDVGLIRMLQRARNSQVTIGRQEALRLADSDSDGLASVAMKRRHRRGDADGATGWTWEGVARAIRFYDDRERERLTGADVAEAPDAAYARWCALAYTRTIDAGEPIVEDVRAIVMRGDGTTMESRYRRLLLPFGAAEGGSLVLVRSEIVRNERPPAPRVA